MDAHELQKKEIQRMQDFRLILRDLLKVIKVVSLYPENNPLPQSLKRTFSEKLEELATEHGETCLIIQKTCLTLDGEIVFTDKSKEESLAALFFDAGITKLIFKEGLDVIEIYKFLDVIKEFVNRPGKDCDLVSMLWEANLSRVGFITIEDIELSEYEGEFKVDEICTSGGTGVGGIELIGGDAETYKSIFNTSAAPSPDQTKSTQPEQLNPEEYQPHRISAITIEEAGGTILDSIGVEGTTEAAEAMGLADLKPAKQQIDTTLILNDELQLSNEEELLVKEITNEDTYFDMFESTVELVKELLHQESEMSAFYETVTIAEKIQRELVENGKFIHAGQLLSYFKLLKDKIAKERPLWSERLKDSLITAGSRDNLRIVRDSLNQHKEVSSGELRRYLDNFGWEILAGLTDLIGELEHIEHNDALSDYLAACGKENPHIVAKGLSDKRWEVVRNSVMILCRIGDEKALGKLKNVLSHNDRRVRLALVQQLSNSKNSEALSLLEHGVRDTDTEVRRESVQTIVEWRGTEAFDAITRILNDDSFTSVAPDDQEAILIAYSVLGGDQAVEFLVKLAKRMNLLGSATISLQRQAAFQALSKNKSDRCERALLKLSSSIRPEIKENAIEALKKRREFIFGGKDD